MTPPRTQLERQVLRQLTASTSAWLLGLSDSGFRGAKPPRSPDGKKYDAPSLVRWHVARRLEALPVDPMLTGGDSPSLERYRLSRARLSELEYALKCRAAVPVAEMHAITARLAAHLRALGETLGARFGPEAQHAMNDSLDEFIELVEHAFATMGPTGALAGDEPGEPDAAEDTTD